MYRASEGAVIAGFVVYQGNASRRALLRSFDRGRGGFNALFIQSRKLRCNQRPGKPAPRASHLKEHLPNFRENRNLLETKGDERLFFPPHRSRPPSVKRARQLAETGFFAFRGKSGHAQHTAQADKRKAYGQFCNYADYHLSIGPLNDSCHRIYQRLASCDI